MESQHVDQADLARSQKTAEMEKQDRHDIPDSHPAAENRTAKMVYPPFFTRSIVVLSLMLATFLVSTLPTSFT